MPAKFINTRTESEEVMVLRSLNNRMKLSPEDLIYYRNLERGLVGERLFDEHLKKKLTNDYLVISDITFKHNNKTFQIDSLVISQHKIYIFEVKYFEGDYIIKDNHFCTLNGKERYDPMSQLNRTESLMRQLLQYHNINIQREGYVVFVNPEFYLYNAPLNHQVIFPTQINRFLKKLDSIPSQLNSFHYNLADKLMEISLKETQYSQIPKYEYNDLRKGFICEKCNTIISDFKGHNICCNHCGHLESFQSAVLRHTEEFSLLFPDRKITTRSIMEWCNQKEHEKTFQRILLKNYVSVGFGKGTYYIKEVEV